MELFAMTYYTTSLKLLLKFLKRRKGLTCEHIKEIPYYDKRFTRYVLVCRDKEKNEVWVEVFCPRE